MKATPCGMRRRVEGHFARRLAPTQERALRGHLPGCPDCRAYYERHLLLQRLDPAAPSAELRLGQGLGLVRAPTPPLLRGAQVALAAAAVLALGLWTTGRLEPLPAAAPRPSVAADGPAGFTARGSPLAPQWLGVFRVRPGEPPSRVGEQLLAGDELAFTYRNPAGRAWLLVYGRDEHGHVYWFHPRWEDAADDPAALPARSGEGPHELTEAILHAYDGGRLTLHAVLSDQRLTVRQVERLLEEVPPGAPLPLAGAEHSALGVQVRR